LKNHLEAIHRVFFASMRDVRYISPGDDFGGDPVVFE
jgi:hypothetical protein